jgi:predicted Zn-ribbon and HTH transcriptional regulator
MVVKASEREEEYFAKMEFERRKKAMEEEHRKVTAENRRKLKELHHMRCPKCGMELIEVNYKGIKTDECSECKGIWLDAGELETVSKLEKTGMEKFFSIFTD